MARPREFDEELVLNSAVEGFWQNGYEATSVRDLAQRMGLTQASLYNAFGDKRSLYRTALNHYIEQSFGSRVARFETLPPREAISAFFEEIIDRSINDPSRKGCMLVNSALELAPHDPEFQQTIAGVLVEVEDFFLRCVATGQHAGTISTAQSAEDLSRLLLGIHLAIRVMARVRPERQLMEGLLRPVFSLFGSPSINVS
jgi:TetR/AcrR family transcriptional repressor of nem operon